MNMRVYLIAYDIGQLAARSAMARKLEKIGKRIQKSLFIVKTTPDGAKNLERDLQTLLGKNDLLLIMPLCENCYSDSRLYGPLPPAMIFA